jgi:hypothetical protein
MPSVRMSSHFLQAHALLNLHLLHSCTSRHPGSTSDSPAQENGFQIYSPLSHITSHSAPSPGAEDAGAEKTSSFTADDLLSVMRRIITASHSLSYFDLCHELGADVVDSMVRGRILELRWSAAVTEEAPKGNEDGALGPRLFATTPIVKYAMKEVLNEYKLKGWKSSVRF